ncbi:MAG: type II secretion system protein GspD [Planctomycetota bacterium]
MKLQPSFSVVTGTVDVGDSAETTYPQPIVDKRVAETTLLVKNGVTVVLGGLRRKAVTKQINRRKAVTKQINKVPLLGDIPVAGHLFRFKAEETVMSEIVVFVTPWIIEEPVMTSEEKEAYEYTDFPERPRISTTKSEEEARIRVAE